MRFHQLGSGQDTSIITSHVDVKGYSIAYGKKAKLGCLKKIFSNRVMILLAFLQPILISTLLIIGPDDDEGDIKKLEQFLKSLPYTKLKALHHDYEDCLKGNDKVPH